MMNRQIKSLSRQQLKKRQKGEMPIGDVLKIALIVIPLVILLIVGANWAKEKLSEAAGTLDGQEVDTAL